MSYLEGIDVSGWQDTTPNLAGLSFAFARACYGTHPDVRYSTHAAAFRKAGIVSGAYCFGVFGDGAAQARVFLDLAHDADLFALDVETEQNLPPMTPAQARAFIATVQQAGYRCGLYHSLSNYPDYGQDWAWVAYWSKTTPRIPWAFWQYRGAPLDLDRFEGSHDELLALTARPEVVTDTAEWDRLATAIATRVRYIRNLVHAGVTDAAQYEDDLAAITNYSGRLRDGWASAAAEIVVDPDPLGPGIEIGPEPATPPTPARTPIPLEPTHVPAVVSYVAPITPAQITLAGLPALRYGTSGPAFVVVHGGPVPVGHPEQLSDLGSRIAVRGGQAFLVDYDATDWHRALADVKAAILGTPALPLTVVGHSFGGWLAGIAVLRDGFGDALVHVCASIRADFANATDEPDLMALAANRPSVPVTVIDGQLDQIGGSPEERQAFVAALHAAGHPGLNVLGPGDHTGTLYTDAALDAMFATAAMLEDR